MAADYCGAGLLKLVCPPKYLFACCCGASRRAGVIRPLLSARISSNTMPVRALMATVDAYIAERTYNNLILPSTSWSIRSSVTAVLTAGVMNVFAFGGDF